LNDRFGSIPADGAPDSPMTACGQKRSLAGAWRNDRLRIRKLPFAPIAAAQNDLRVGYVSFGIFKQKLLDGAEFVTF